MPEAATRTMAAREHLAPIPLVDLAFQHAAIAAEIAPELERVMQAGCFVDGPDVRRFEEELAAFSGAAHAVGVASGTDALEIALRAAGVRHGDEVIVPANTFAATAEAVVRLGACPVFADVDPATLLIDFDHAQSLVSVRTTAVIPVHLYGQMVPPEATRRFAARHGLVVVADAAQAQGARAAGAGPAHGVAAAATSFYPGKNLGAYGDAGAVLTDDPRLAQLARSIGHHGVDGDRYHHVRFGCTSRLDTMQAVVLRAKLARLATWNRRRAAAAATYADLLGPHADRITLPVCLEGHEHAWHLYVVRVARRDEVLQALHLAGVAAGVHYPLPLHQQPAFATGGRRVVCPNAERASDTVLSLPLFPGITDEQQARVAHVLLAATRA